MLKRNVSVFVLQTCNLITSCLRLQVESFVFFSLLFLSHCVHAKKSTTNVYRSCLRNWIIEIVLVLLVLFFSSLHHANSITLFMVLHALKQITLPRYSEWAHYYVHQLWSNDCAHKVVCSTNVRRLIAVQAMKKKQKPKRIIKKWPSFCHLNCL